MDVELRSLKNLQRMPVPSIPRVKNYGLNFVGANHEVALFPAILRKRKITTAEAIIEDGQSSCYFHPKFTATAVCDLSGRMICDLCKTEWNGQTISFEALQNATAPRRGKKKGKIETRTKWDSIALALALWPLILWFVTLITAPIVLFICIWKWRGGPTSILRTSRWRYVVAGIISLIEIAFWVWFFVWGLSI